ncbi:MAG: hypothetical protein U0736_17235 [Gemmataceae bacterium]
MQAKPVLARLFRRAGGWKTTWHGSNNSTPMPRRPRRSVGHLRRDSHRRRRVLAPPPARGDWPGVRRSGVPYPAGPATPRLLDRLSLLCRSGPAWQFDLETRKQQAGPPVAPARGGEIDAARRLAFFPVVVGHVALVADARYVTAYDLRTGAATVWYDAAAYVGGLKPRLGLPAAVDLRYTLTVAEDCVFARLGTQTVRDVRPAGRGRRWGGPRGRRRERAGVAVAAARSRRRPAPLDGAGNRPCPQGVRRVRGGAGGPRRAGLHRRHAVRG